MDARSGGQARLPKALMDVMGFNVGPSRPPSKPINIFNCYIDLGLLTIYY